MTRVRLVPTSAAILFACPAVALDCQPAGGLHQILSEEYGEAVIRSSACTADGVNGRCLTFRNATTGTWTIAFYPATGVACLLAVGADSERDG